MQGSGILLRHQNDVRATEDAQRKMLLERQPVSIREMHLSTEHEVRGEAPQRQGVLGGQRLLVGGVQDPGVVLRDRPDVRGQEAADRTMLQ